MAPDRRIDSSLGELCGLLLALLRPRQKLSGHPGIRAWLSNPPMPGISFVGSHEEVEVVDLRLVALLLHESCEGIALPICFKNTMLICAIRT